MEPEELIYLRLDINAHVPIATKMRIAGLLARLPEQVCEFAIKKIFFYSMGQHARLGMASHRRDIGHWEIITEYGFHYRTDYEWLVWLLDEEVENGDEGLATIAHEIAHAWLRHRQYEKDETREARAERAYLEERAASQQAMDWGFSGISADPDAYPGERCEPERDYYAAKIIEDYKASFYPMFEEDGAEIEDEE